MRLDESAKTVLAMTVGGATSIITGVTNVIKGYSIKLIASIPMFSLEYLEMLFTAFLLGVVGALGGLLVRETYKYLTKTKGDDNEE